MRGGYCRPSSMATSPCTRAHTATAVCRTPGSEDPYTASRRSGGTPSAARPPRAADPTSRRTPDRRACSRTPTRTASGRLAAGPTTSGLILEPGCGPPNISAKRPRLARAHLRYATPSARSRAAWSSPSMPARAAAWLSPRAVYPSTISSVTQVVAAMEVVVDRRRGDPERPGDGPQREGSRPRGADLLSRLLLDRQEKRAAGPLSSFPCRPDRLAVLPFPLLPRSPCPRDTRH